MRLIAARTFLVLQNIGVALSCAALAAHFAYGNLLPLWLDDSRMVAAIVIFAANIANLASLGSKIVVEKDWIVVISGGNKNSLANMNAVFRTIDLTCYVLAPAATGALFHALGNGGTAVFIAVWNIVSMALEYCLLLSVYHRFPELAQKRGEEGGSDMVFESQENTGAWRAYLKHPVRNAGIALSSFYMTVLGFDSVTYGYCLNQGVPEALLGALVGLSAGVGMLGSLSYPGLRRGLNVNRTGALGMAWLLSAHAACVASVWMPGSPFQPYIDASSHQKGANMSHLADTRMHFLDAPDSEKQDPTSVTVLIVGIVLARFGLWLADLSITQILQESVEEEIRGTLGGVQGSLNAISDTIKYVLVALFPTSGLFGYLILASYSSYSLGSASFLTYACKTTSRWRDGGGAGVQPDSSAQGEGKKLEAGGAGGNYGGI